MARQKRQETGNGDGSRRGKSLADVLAATQRHSVPVLPAFGPQGQPIDPETYQPGASYTRNTLAPHGTTRQRTLADTTGALTNTTNSTNSTNTTRGRSSGQADQQAHQQGGPMRAQPSASLHRDRSQTASRAGYSTTGGYDGYTGSGAYRDDGGLPAGVADEVYDAETAEQHATTRGARGASAGASVSRALVPGQPSLGLPSLPADLLPTVAEESASRQLALAESPAPDAQAVLIRGTSKALKPYSVIVPKRQGPRSFLSQFIISMVAVMTIFTVLTLASPLGHSQAFAGTFQSYANAVPWVPTPTPTPKPTPVPAYVPPAGANPGQQAVINDIVAVFGSNAQGAINVARCESGFDPNAWNPYAIGGSHASGVFQILYPSTWSTTSWSGQSPYNYDANIHAAYQIFARDGYSWREWSCGIYA